MPCKGANPFPLEAILEINNNKNRVIQASEVFKDTIPVVFVALLWKRGQHFTFLALLMTTQQLKASMNFWE